MANRLVRKQTYIYKRQQVLLKQLARDRGLSDLRNHPPGYRPLS